MQQMSATARLLLDIYLNDQALPLRFAQCQGKFAMIAK